MKTLLKYHHYFYLLLALLGGGITFYFALCGIVQHQGHFDIFTFIRSTWTDSFYAKSLTFDFWTGVIAGTFFILFEGLRLKMRGLVLYLLVTVCVAFAFGFPLFLFMHALHLKKQEK